LSLPVLGHPAAGVDERHGEREASVGQVEKAINQTVVAAIVGAMRVRIERLDHHP
jgi:hypothetical protein